MIKSLKHVDPAAMFQGKNCVFRADQIEYVDITYIESEFIVVKIHGKCDTVIVSGFDALDLVWRIKPGALEGKRLKFPKHSWAFHNLVAHPVMQLIAFFGFTKAAMWVHDKTVPKPARRV